MRVYNAVINYEERSAEDSVSKKIEDELSKYPSEAQNLKLTKLCQEMQRPLIIEKGVQSDQAERVSLPVCTCISSALMKTPVFKDIQSMADRGSDFFKILSTHREVFTQAMSSCGK